MVTGYNHERAEYLADSNPHKGTGPTKPATVAAPYPLSWASGASAGGPGSGLVSLAALTERIHVRIPDGDTDKLGSAADAWNAFLGTRAIEYAGSMIADVAIALRQNQAHEMADLDDLVMMLSASANKVYAGAKSLGSDCEKHKQALDQLRKDIQGPSTTSKLPRLSPWSLPSLPMSSQRASASSSTPQHSLPTASISTTPPRQSPVSSKHSTSTAS